MQTQLHFSPATTFPFTPARNLRAAPRRAPVRRTRPSGTFAYLPAAQLTLTTLSLATAIMALIELTLA